MITLITSTNRNGSNTKIVSDSVLELLQNRYEHRTLHQVDLIGLPWDADNMYDHPPEALVRLTNNIMVPTRQFIFVIPEYNGSFPGILKLFIDAMSIINYKSLFAAKQVVLIGIADGKAGNIRGLDQFAGILRHMGGQVINPGLHLSQISKRIQENRLDSKTTGLIKKHIDKYLI